MKIEQTQTKRRYYNTIRNQFENKEVLFDLPLRVYYWYCRNVRNNQTITYDEAKKKLSRNCYLAWENKWENPDSNKKYLHYGNLLICLKLNVFGNYEICYIKNSSKPDIFDTDIEYRSYLNSRFNIIHDDKFIYKNNDTYNALEEVVYTTENNI